jgi:hypothetical protein
VLRGRGCDVSQAAIEFTDSHYAKNFQEFPFRHEVFSILPLLWPQLRRKNGQIRIPEAAKQDGYDLVVSSSRRATLRAGSSAVTRRPAIRVISRCANSLVRATEVSVEGGTGVPSGIRTRSDRRRAPRARSDRRAAATRIHLVLEGT